MRVMGLVLITLLLVPLLCLVKPAHAIMPEFEAKNIVASSYQAVQASLDALQTANGSGDVQQIDQALKALNLSISNYAVASENLARLQAGTLKSDSTLTTCYLIADKLSLFSSQLLNKNPKSAWFFYTEAQSLGAFLPPPANPAGIPAGLADLQSQIISASSEAVSTLRSAGIAEEEKKRGEGKLGINTHVGSPI